MSEEESELSAAERRLVALLLLLRQETRTGEADLTERIMRGVRLQFATRGLIRAAASLAVAVADALVLMLGRRTSRDGT